MRQTSVKNLMKENPVIIPVDSTLRETAERMETVNCGVLLVGTPEKLEGIIMDRDIVVRAVAKGKDINRERVGNYMTTEVFFCKEDDTPDRAAGLIREKNIDRVVVEDKNGNPCGIITFGHIIRKNESMTEIATAIECAVGRKAA